MQRILFYIGALVVINLLLWIFKAPFFIW